MTDARPKETSTDRVGMWQLLDDGKVLEGKNGRLFLSNDSNDVVHQHTGELLLSDTQVRGWQNVLENRFRWLERQGTAYCFLVAPTAHSVFPEELPENLPQGRTRPILQILEQLRSSKSFARVLYPLDEIAALKPDPYIFSPTNSHWGPSGAFCAYRSVIREVADRVTMHQVCSEALEFQDTLYTGDLGFKMKPKCESRHRIVTVPKPRAYLVSDNRIHTTGSKIVFECPEAPPSRCVMFGDSFAEALLPFFAASFRRFVYAFLPTLDYGFVREERPDVVVSVMNERFLLVVPDDDGARTLREHEAEKRAAGRFRDEIQRFPKQQGE
jgi:alginate O-acetyltransferase complex protein AlgJ